MERIYETRKLAVCNIILIERKIEREIDREVDRDIDDERVF